MVMFSKEAGFLDSHKEKEYLYLSLTKLFMKVNGKPARGTEWAERLFTQDNIQLLMKDNLTRDVELDVEE